MPPPPVKAGSNASSVILVGSWKLGAKRDPDEVFRTAPHELRSVLVRQRPKGLLLGDDLDERELTKLALLAQQVQTGIDIAVIGPDEDYDRCERWLCRGARVYLSRDCSIHRALLLIKTARENQVIIVDDCFLKERARRAALTGSAVGPRRLTDRESDVLRYVRLGFRNADIARELHLSPRTVHFHMTHILDKLGAANRTDAAERARFLML